MRVFLTGATGLVGSHLAEALVARGDEVTALVRESSDTAFLNSLGVRTAVGDITDPAERLAEALAGSEAIVHSAALVYPGLPWPRVRAVNVEATHTVLTRRLWPASPGPCTSPRWRSTGARPRRWTSPPRSTLRSPRQTSTHAPSERPRVRR